jgi:sulfofructosephosphate aldolase
VTPAGMKLDALARPSGTFVMVAMDQRESLRTMLRERGLDPTDERVARFKLAVARELAPHASGFLIDRDHVHEVAPHAPRGLILAVDRLVQEPGGPVEDTSVDEDSDVASAVVALKLLVIWRDDAERARRVEMSHRFVELARRHGVLSVLEGVVRGPDGFDREAAIVEAGRELAASGCDLYKCEVPTHGRAAPEQITRWSREIDAAVPCPWVVLSQGVEPDAYPRAVEAACRGGASGILAGRAVWTATLAADDPTTLLRDLAVPRLTELARIVDRHGRPWRNA